jgi:hypothetical protein
MVTINNLGDFSISILDIAWGDCFFLTKDSGQSGWMGKPLHQYLLGGLEPWNFMTFQILGISSSQLTFTPSFFRGVGLNHQPE